MIDCHVHTDRCGHAEGSLDEFVSAAARAGVTTMAFTDHLPLPEGYPEGYSMTASELPLYAAEVLRVARERAGDPPEVLLGIEADWLPGREAELIGVLGAYPFDVVLGSVHFIDEWAFDDPELTDGYAHWDVTGLWERYFADVVMAASSGLFDVMAHPDLVKKFCFRPETEPLDLYAEVAQAFARADVAVEVSTAGLRKPCAEIYPSLAFLKACRAQGVAATVGSDAHRPDEVGFRLGEAREMLRAAGYESIVVYRGRRPEEHAL